MNLNNTILIILGIISGILVLPRLTNISIIVLVSLILTGYGISKDYLLSLSVAAIITYIMVLLNTSTPPKIQVENFKSKSKSKSKSKKKKKKKKRSENKEPDKHLINDPEKSIEFFDDDEVINEDETGEHFFDSKNTFYENYKALTPSQLKGLNSDTKELIDTQKSLIETLKNMGPTLKEGKNVLDTFKNYFGKDGDIGSVLK